MIDFIIFIFLFFYFFLAAKRLDWAVMLMLAALPSYLIRFEIFGIPFTVLEAMILIAFAVWVFKKTALKDFLRGRYRVKDFIRNRKERQRYPFSWEIILLLVISWVAIAVAGFSDAAMGIWKAYFFEPVLVFILVLNVFKTPSVSSHLLLARRGMIDRILLPLAISAFWISGLAIIERLTGWNAVPEFWPRLTGPFPYPNALGLYLGPIVLILFGFLLAKIKAPNPKSQINSKFQTRNSKLEIIFLITTVLFSILAIIFASSEGALVGILIAGFILGLFLFINKKPKFKWLPPGVIAAVFSFVVFSSLFFLFVVPEYKYFNFSCGTMDYLSDKAMLKDMSGEIRKQQWRETGEMMKGDYRWLLGTGLSGYQATIKSYHQEGIFFNFSRDKDFRQKIVWWNEEYKAKHWQPVEIYMYPHNLVLNFWTELGLLGVILFIWIITKFYYLGIKTFIQNLKFTRQASTSKIQNSKQVNSQKYIILGLIGAMLVIIVHGTVDVPYFKNDLAVIFWVLLAMIGIVKLGIKEKKK